MRSSVRHVFDPPAYLRLSVRHVFDPLAYVCLSACPFVMISSTTKKSMRSVLILKTYIFDNFTNGDGRVYWNVRELWNQQNSRED